MENWQKQVLTEKFNLAKKIDKLDKYINVPGFETLPDPERLLLNLQLNVMTTYHTILNWRTKLFTTSLSD